MSVELKKCCLKNCQHGQIIDRRVEIKTAFPKSGFKEQNKFVVNWRANGEAEFHIECWEKLLKLSRTRPIKTSGMTKEERALVKIASEAPEQFDSISKIVREAQRAADWVKSAKHCVAFTGAGISTSAGIGDYRGKSGKWTEEDQTIAVSQNSVLAGSSDDRDEPGCKKQRLGSSSEEKEEEDGVPYEKLRPTYTHEALQKLMLSGYLKYIISQNGDGLHTLSGIPENQISELHGNVFIEVCEKCGCRYNRKFYVMDDQVSQYYEEIEDFGKSSVKKPKYATKCDRCGLSHRTGRKCEQEGCKGYLRDTIINFRDLLEEDILDKARANSQQCDVMLCLGTTLQVTPAADLIKKMKNRNRLIICNRQETPVDDMFGRTGPDGEPVGCRVFGDCDLFMKEMMKHIYSEEELRLWEADQQERMKTYNSQRE